MHLAPGIAALRAAGRFGLNLLLPPSCMSCDIPVADPFQLCAACFSHCHFITAPFCRSCGAAFLYEGQRGIAGICPECVEHPPRFHAARAALVYDTNSRGLLLAFKHADRTELARLFAPMLARAGASLLKNADYLVPVPLHLSRLRQRGFNQSALLAQQLSRLAHVPALLDALQRTRRTPSLGHLDPAQRRAAMHNVIIARPRRAEALVGQRVVLVDDVMTSGATSNACAEALLNAGAARVDVVVVARVPDPQADGG